MKATVYHAKEIFAANKFPEDYDEVAFVELPDMDIDMALEEIFRLTNHIDSNWTTNAGVIAKSKNLRSTSVGDVVVIGNKRFLCEPTDWTKLE